MTLDLIDPPETKAASGKHGKAFENAAYSHAGDGTTVYGLGPHVIRISAADTGGRMGVFEAKVPAGEGPPPHVHEREDEFFRVLEGGFAFWCNGAHVELDAGGVIVVPRGSVHRFQNVANSAGRIMTVVTPGGFEGFFGAVGAEQPQSPAGIEAIAARFHLRFEPSLS